jgi:hypothetical protein
LHDNLRRHPRHGKFLPRLRLIPPFPYGFQTLKTAAVRRNSMPGSAGVKFPNLAHAWKALIFAKKTINLFKYFYS